jgi:ABC-type amino acid transport substrate-binding protein
MRTNRRSVLGALSAALILSSARAQAPTWKVFGSDRYEPLLYPKDGQPAGTLAETLLASQRLSGDRFALELVLWQRALRLAEAGEGGLLGVSRNREREVWLDFSRPIYEDRLLLLVRKGEAFRFRSLADLEGKRIGMAMGTTGGDAFDEAERNGRLQVIRDQSAPRRLQALLAGRMDAAVIGGGPASLGRVVGRMPDPEAGRARLELMDNPLLRDPLHLAFPKRLGAGAVIDRFNAALLALRRAPPPGPG